MPENRFLRTLTPTLTLTLAAGVFVTACTAANGASPREEDGEGAYAGGPKVDSELPPISFSECSLVTGENARDAECATVQVPLEWDAVREGGKRAYRTALVDETPVPLYWEAGTERTITLFVKRILGKAPVRRQVWLLAGGPGGAGDSFEGMARELAKDPTLDVYIPDHRGTGRSTMFDCKETSAKSKGNDFDMKACIAELRATWGEQIRGFSTTNAAKDLGFLVERTRTRGQPVHVYGVSYGTYLAQRYAQIFPDQAESVALDGVCATGFCSPLKYWYWGNEVGKRFLGECSADPFCAKNLGPNPYERLREALDAVERQSCAGTEGLKRDDVRGMFGNFLTHPVLRTLVPAFAFRVLRCSADDVAAIKNFVAAQKDRPADDDPFFSQLLFFHIAFSETEEAPPATAEELRSIDEEVLFGSVDAESRGLYDEWPRYERDAYVGRFPNVRIPVLIMNGTLDPQTPITFAEHVAGRLNTPDKRFVAFPYLTHGLVPFGYAGAPPFACASGLWFSFVKNPGAPLDESCTSQIPRIDFRGTRKLANDFFKTPSLWGVPDDTPPASVPGEDNLRALRRPLWPTPRRLTRR